MAHGYYIIASRQSGAYRLPLLGPFKRMGQAIAMLDVTVAATRRIRPDLDDCDILPAPVAVVGRLPPGALDLTLAVDEDWIRACIMK